MIWPSVLLAASLAFGMPVPATAETACGAHPRPACVTAAEKAEFCPRFIGEKLAIWQRRLKLEEWRITVAMTAKDDLKPSTLGGIRWDKKRKTAVVSVLSPSEYKVAFQEMLDDMEFTVVHELVHLELASLPKKEASRRVEEHAVNRIAEALLALDRERSLR